MPRFLKSKTILACPHCRRPRYIGLTAAAAAVAAVDAAAGPPPRPIVIATAAMAVFRRSSDQISFLQPARSSLLPPSCAPRLDAMMTAAPAEQVARNVQKAVRCVRQAVLLQRCGITFNRGFRRPRHAGLGHCAGLKNPHLPSRGGPSARRAASTRGRHPTAALRSR